MAGLFDTAWARAHLTQPERTALKHESWFETFEAFAETPPAALLDLARRLREGQAVVSTDADPASPLSLAAHADTIEAMARLGVHEAAEEKLGVSGVLAGHARIKRDEFYRTGDRHTQLEALELFMNALAVGDDPVVFDNGKTMQGFASVLFDLGVELRSPALMYVTVMAETASLAARFSNPPPDIRDDLWLGIIRKVVWGTARMFDKLHEFESDIHFLNQFSTMERELRNLEDLLQSQPTDEQFWPHAHRIALAGLLISRVRPELPPDTDELVSQIIELARSLVYQYLQNWSSDSLRLLIRFPPLEALALPDDEDLRNTMQTTPTTTRSHPPTRVAADFQEALDRLQINPRPDATEDEILLFRNAALLDEICLAVTHGDSYPAECTALVESARLRLDELTRNHTRATEHLELATKSLLHLMNPAADLSRLCSIAEGYFACVDGDFGTGLHKLRSAVLHPDMGLLIDSVAATMTSWMDSLPDDDSVPPQASPDSIPVGAIKIATIALAGAMTLDATSRNFGRQDIQEQVAVLAEKLLNAGASQAFPKPPPERQTFTLRDDASEEVARQLVWILKPSYVHYEDWDIDRSRLLEVLPQAYSAGQFTLHDPMMQFQLANNLGTEYNSAGDPWKALPWLMHARTLATQSQQPADLATADLNLAYSIRLIAEVLIEPWSLDIDEQYPALNFLLFCLAAVSEGLRALNEFESHLPARDRFSLYDQAFLEFQEQAKWALLRLQDHALLAEYLMNIRSSWYYSELVNEAANSETSLPSRTRITWRGRCWLSHVPIDLVTRSPGSGLGAEQPQSGQVEALDLLERDDKAQAWLGTLVDAQSHTYSSSFLFTSQVFGSQFRTLESPADWSHLPIDEVALSLGSTLPDEFWLVAGLLVQSQERGTLYVSIDPLTPPVGVGHWSSVTDDGPVRVCDAFDVVYCPDLKGGHPPQRHSAPAEIYVVCDPVGDLPQARRAPEAAVALCGNADAGRAAPANKGTVIDLLSQCAAADGVFLYQGHSDVGTVGDPGSASLILEPDPLSQAIADRLTVTEILAELASADSSTGLPERMIFLSCNSGISTSTNDSTSLAAGALAGGATHVISTLAPVSEDSFWDDIIKMAISVLSSPQPEEEFGRWQQSLNSSTGHTARQLQDLLSITLFSTPIACGGPPNE